MHPAQGFRGGQFGNIDNIQTIYGNSQGFRLEPLSVTDGAWRRSHISFNVSSRVAGFCVAIYSFKIRDGAFVSGEVFPDPTVAISVFDQFSILAVQN
jgi:hypothetical protein